MKTDLHALAPEQLRSVVEETLETVFTGKSGYQISIWRHGLNDFAAAWGDDYSVRGTLLQVLEELKGEF